MLLRAPVGFCTVVARGAFTRLAYRPIRMLACVLVALSAISSFAAEVTVFGPQTYSRGRGRPVAVKKTFRVPAPSGRYTLRVRNEGVTSAVIRLNGRRVL